MITMSIPSESLPGLGMAVMLVSVILMYIADSSNSTIGKILRFVFVIPAFVGAGMFFLSFAGLGADYKTFDNPIVAAVERGDSSRSVEFNENKLKQSILETAELDKIVEMRSGSGYYKTLSVGDEIKFTAEKDNSEKVEGTVSYTADSIIVKITGADGNTEVFRSAV